jgi:tellurite resistance protein
MQESEELKFVPSNRLQFFPVMMFAIVMGLSGLTLVYIKAHEVLDFPIIIATSLKIVTGLIFLAITFIYIIKLFMYISEVKKEFSHPIRINFFAAISISILLISMIFKHDFELLALILFFIGMFLHLFFTFYTFSFWINNNVEIQHSNPAWFIPVVGNLIVPVAGVGIIDNDFLMFFFSIGIFFWIIMLSIVFNRIIFHKQFAPKFMPTLFILIAPPSVGLLSYYKMLHTLDTFSIILFNLGLFFAFLLLFMYKNFLKIKFFISWWAFTFPLATISLASMLMFDTTNKNLYWFLSLFFIAVLSVVVIVVTYYTLVNMLKKEICIME